MNKDIFIQNGMEIEEFPAKLGDVICEYIQEEVKSDCKIGTSIAEVLLACKTQQEFEIAEKMLVAVCGKKLEEITQKLKGYEIEFRYPYLSTLECFERLINEVPTELTHLEALMRWYEEEATDEEIEEIGDHLPTFLQYIYGNVNIEEYLQEVRKPIAGNADGFEAEDK